MHQIIKGMVKLAEEKGVKFLYNQEVKSIEVFRNQIKKVMTTQGTFEADVVIGGADYQHIETQLLNKEYRSYSENYWDSRTLAPSCLIFYLGLNKN